MANLNEAFKTLEQSSQIPTRIQECCYNAHTLPIRHDIPQCTPFVCTPNHELPCLQYGFTKSGLPNAN